jgi:hypothetical protein
VVSRLPGCQVAQLFGALVLQPFDCTPRRRRQSKAERVRAGRFERECMRLARLERHARCRPKHINKNLGSSLSLRKNFSKLVDNGTAARVLLLWSSPKRVDGLSFAVEQLVPKSRCGSSWAGENPNFDAGTARVSCCWRTSQ